MLSLVKSGQESSLEQTPIIFKEREEGLIYQRMPLPNETYCLLPQRIQKDHVFRVEVGWVRKTDLLVRSRLIRHYNTHGI